MCILRKVSITERDLSKVTPATLLKSLSILGNFSEILQGFNKNNFQYKNTTETLFRKLTSDADVCDRGVILSYNCNTSSASQIIYRREDQR